ncbi:MAG: 1-(5-phosphoribosyl)-5-amino-4-imidazole-carboxylate carboxylase, partial [Acidimicrobiia bacterium]|nr:1-(5-phosphoribosyl)-5-amino-4-imidazole-carboxylate carboxylase [Acidimicrobiia bacterium]
MLDAVAAGVLSTADAVLRICTQPYVDAEGFAKVDLHRRVRCGFPEVIFGQGKTAQQIEAILRALITHGQGGLVTRVEPAAAAHLRSAFPEGQHNPVGRT